MEPVQPTSSKRKGILIAIIVIGIATVGSILTSQKKTIEGISQLPVETPTSTLDNTPSSKTGVYRDGTYTATGSYMSPGGRDEITVTLTLKGEVVTESSVVPKPGDETSAYYEEMFAANYSPLVVGKSIATLKLDKVSGSSLTPKGFNDAIAQIRQQAKG